MGKHSKIPWCDDTWNPWRGCKKKPGRKGCAHCYAEHSTPSRTARHNGIETWGDVPRIQAGEATLREPFRWNKKPWICNECGAALDLRTDHLKPDGNMMCWGPTPTDEAALSRKFHRARVFSLSLGDWLDDMPAGMRTLDGKKVDPIEAQARFLDTVRQCDQLDWLLCSKRWEDFSSLLGRAESYCATIRKGQPGDTPTAYWLDSWIGKHPYPPKNVWGLCSVEDQETADKVIPEFLQVPLAVHGLSVEPLLGEILLDPWLLAPTNHRMRGRKLFGYPCIDWVIVGGESGPNARPCNVEWIRSIVKQCKAAGVPCFVKQLGSNPHIEAMARPAFAGCFSNSIVRVSVPRDQPAQWVPIGMKHPKGGDPDEWPEDLRVRQFPKGAR